MRVFLKFLGAHFANTIRDRMALFWFLAFPLLFVFLFGLIFGNMGSSFDLRVGVASGAFLPPSLQSPGIRGLVLFEGSEEAELAALRKGQRDVVVSRRGDELLLFTTPREAEKAEIFARVLENILLREELRKQGLSPSLRVRVTALMLPSFRQIDYFLPGVLAMALMQVGLFGALDFVELREKKVTRYLGAMPLRREVVLWSEIAMRVSIALVQTALILFFGWAIFKVQFLGSVVTLLSWVLLGSATFVSLGYFLTSFARTVESASGLIQVVQFPMMFLSGIFFPPEMMPESLRFVVRIFPLSYLGDALRAVAVGIPSQFGLRTDCFVLFSWLLGSFLLARKFFRWE